MLVGNLDHGLNLNKNLSPCSSEALTLAASGKRWQPKFKVKTKTILDYYHKKFNVSRSGIGFV